MMMPEAITMRQKGKPRDSWLVAGLFRLPSMLMPSTIMDTASVTKPCRGLSSGQLRAKYDRNKDSSETRRNTGLR